MEMYLYWPVVLAAITAIILLNPLPIIYPKSRQWFLYTNVSLISDLINLMLMPDSGGWHSRASTRSSFETSSWAISSAPRHTRLATWSCSSASTTNDQSGAVLHYAARQTLACSAFSHAFRGFGERCNVYDVTGILRISFRTW